MKTETREPRENGGKRLHYIKIFTDFRDTVSVLNDAEKGRLLAAMLLYAETGAVPERFAGNECFLWPAAMQSIDRMAETAEREEKKETKKRREGPEKRGEEMRREEMREEGKRDETGKERRFIPPTPEEVEAYCRSQDFRINPRLFHDHYTANGWTIKGQPMKDWKACVRTWEAREKQTGPTAPGDVRHYSQRNNAGAQEQALEKMRQMIRESKLREAEESAAGMGASA